MCDHPSERTMATNVSYCNVNSSFRMNPRSAPGERALTAEGACGRAALAGPAVMGESGSAALLPRPRAALVLDDGAGASSGASMAVSTRTARAPALEWGPPCRQSPMHIVRHSGAGHQIYSEDRRSHVQSLVGVCCNHLHPGEHAECT